MGEYKLSAALAGHDDDVRSVVFASSKTVLSASRDSTVRIWRLQSAPPPVFDDSISSHGSEFVNAVAYLPPREGFPDGLVVSGGKDMIIEVREFGKAPDTNAERLLTGHAHNVCTLDVSPDGKWIVSGSWDASARVWGTQKWECDAVLEGHEASVWAVLAYDPETIITACADKMIRVFTPTGKLLQSFLGSAEVVRALCKLPKGHPSGADFASAGNDGVIRLWRLQGKQVGELHGHENFVYSLACLPNGDIVSSGEDRTLRIWRGQECIQTITHPAISVWTVAACPETGDIASGASDKIVRLFSTSPERQADAQAIQYFEESVKSSSIPQQQLGEINKEKLPGPEFLQQKSGTKEGQVVMIREDDGSVTAHTWSSAASQWMNVGTVVDAVGSSGKKTGYQGKEYDYVFDVDIEDGKPPLKLPYNLSQNPYEAATKFIEDNELPIGYLDQVANFITQNTQGATLGQSQNAPQARGADPWGTENRYRPGQGNQPSAPATAPAAPRAAVIPQKQYLSIKTANLKIIQKKLEELNEQLLSAGDKEAALNPPQIEALRRLTTALDTDPSSIKDADGIALVLQIIRTWPPASRLPALDLLRLATAATPLAAQHRSGDDGDEGTLVGQLAQSGTFADAARPNNAMLATRALANLFETDAGRALADRSFAAVHALVGPAVRGAASPNRNLLVAAATLYINYAVLATATAAAEPAKAPAARDRALQLLDDLTRILLRDKDSEAVYRALVALGTLLTLGEEVVVAAKEIYDVDGVLKKAEGGVREPRIKTVIAEIRELLK